MLFGTPDKFAFLIERVPEWEDVSYVNGIMYVCLNWKMYPDTLRNCAEIIQSFYDKKKCFLQCFDEKNVLIISAQFLNKYCMNKLNESHKSAASQCRIVVPIVFQLFFVSVIFYTLHINFKNA